MVCVDIYVNETTRHADVILPAPSPLERSHYDLALYQLAVRNVANYSPPVLDADPAARRVGDAAAARRVAAGQGADADVEPFDDFVASELIAARGGRRALAAARARPRRAARRAWSRGAARSACSTCMLRTGPYDLTLADLEAAPHGIDLGPLEPRLPDVLRTPSGEIELAPEPIVADVARLRAALDAPARTAGSCSSAAATCARTTRGCTTSSCSCSGQERCTLHVHPDDAARLGLADGGAGARRARARGAVEVPVEVTDERHARRRLHPARLGPRRAPARGCGVAAAHAGVNSNVLADERARRRRVRQRRAQRHPGRGRARGGRRSRVTDRRTSPLSACSTASTATRARRGWRCSRACTRDGGRIEELRAAVREDRLALLGAERALGADGA